MRRAGTIMKRMAEPLRVRDEVDVCEGRGRGRRAARVWARSCPAKVSCIAVRGPTRGLGLGRALTKACFQCAKDAGYDQLELTVPADSDRALTLCRSLGFEEFG